MMNRGQRKCINLYSSNRQGREDGEPEGKKKKLDKPKKRVSRWSEDWNVTSSTKVSLVQSDEVAGGGMTVVSVKPEDEVPLIDWWDEVVLSYDPRGYELIGSGIELPTSVTVCSFSYDSVPPADMDKERRYEKTITRAVHHPERVEPPDEQKAPGETKVSGLFGCWIGSLSLSLASIFQMYLTKKEQKKLRRDNRREELKERTEKIRLGLEKPPEPKVKLSNLMRVLAMEHVQDPTKVETEVRKQVEERKRKHEEENAARKLKKEEENAARKLKKEQEKVASRSQQKHAGEKMDKSNAGSVQVAVYKVRSLRNPKNHFKVLTNAKQLQMTGAVLMLTEGDVNVVVVEGDAKQQKFYRNLMLNRIKWSDEVAGEKRPATPADEVHDGDRNECRLVWEGFVTKRQFSEPRCVRVGSAKEAREFMEKHSAPHYWDICQPAGALKPTKESGEKTGASEGA